MKAFRFFLFFLLSAVFSWALAGTNNGLVYHGRIIKPDGLALDSGTSTFTLQIWGRSDRYMLTGTPTNTNDTGVEERCLLFEETHSKDMSGANGAFELLVGAGSSQQWGAGSDQQLSRLFINYPYNSLTNAVTTNEIPAISCLRALPAATYYPYNQTNTFHEWVDRELVVAVDTGSGSFTLPAMAIRSAPFAMQAAQVAGYSPYNLFKIDGISHNVFSTAQHDFLFNFSYNPAAISVTDPTGTVCVAGKILKVSPAGNSWICADDDGGTGVVTSVTAAAPLLSAGTASAPDIRVISGTLAGQTLRWNGAAWAIASLGISDVSGTVPINRGGTGTTTAPLDGQILIGGTDGYVPANISAGSGLSITNTSGAITIAASNVNPATISNAGNADQIAIYNSGGTLTGMTGANGSILQILAGVPFLGSLDLATSVSGVLPVLSGGTGTNGSTLASYGMLYMDNLGTAISSATLTNGQIMVGSTASTPAPANITGSGGIVVTNGPGTIDIATAAGMISGAGTDGYLAKFDGTASLISSPIYVSTSGNVGIGTTSPSSPLTVSGGITISGNNNELTIPGSVGFNDVITIGNNLSGGADRPTVKVTGANPMLEFSIGAAVSVTQWTPSSMNVNVPIGSNLPNGVTISNFGPGSAGNILLLEQNAFSPAAGIAKGLYNHAGFTPASGNADFISIDISGTINQTGGANGISRGIYVNPTLTSAFDWRAVEIASNSGYGIYQTGSGAKNYFAGNVGVGTTSATHPLTVSGGASISGTIVVAGDINQTGNTVIQNTVFPLYLQTSTPNPIFFRPNGVTAMTIGSTGNVGIGAAPVSEKLEVTGNIKATGQIVTGYQSVAGDTADFNNGNVIELTAVGTNAITLSNMQSGGTYTVIVSDTTLRTYDFTGCGGVPLYSPAKGPTTVGKATIFTILKTATTCYITWLPDFI